MEKRVPIFCAKVKEIGVVTFGCLITCNGKSTSREFPFLYWIRCITCLYYD